MNNNNIPPGGGRPTLFRDARLPTDLRKQDVEIRLPTPVSPELGQLPVLAASATAEQFRTAAESPPAQTYAATCNFETIMQALQRIYQEPTAPAAAASIEPQPFAQMLGSLRSLRSTISHAPGRQAGPLPTTVPHEAAQRVITVLREARDALGHPFFQRVSPRPREDGSITVGKHRIALMEWRDPVDDSRQMLLCIPGLKGHTTGPTALARAMREPLDTLMQAIDIGRSALGDKTPMHVMGELLGPLIAQLGQEAHVTVVAHSYGCVAGEVIGQHAVERQVPITSLLTNPAPLPQVPEDRRARYDAGVAAIGAETLQDLNHVFVAPDDPVYKLQRGRVARKLLDLTGRNGLPPATVHTFHDPSLTPVDQHDQPTRSIGAGMAAARTAGDAFIQQLVNSRSLVQASIGHHHAR